MKRIPHVLKPRLNLMREEFVLVQAWKKTSNYIRYHNWYADTLELDWVTVNLPKFIAEISEALETPDKWKSDPIRLIPAPKKQRWRVLDSGEWKPEKPNTIPIRLRPLAHVSIRDQVVATALMLCLANRIESLQGDPRGAYQSIEYRRKVNSYGNRLFCDKVDGKLHHRWGSSKLYRSYFQDYQSFITRPSMVAKSVGKNRNGGRVFIVESDLSQFYDRVRPKHLLQALHRTQPHDGYPRFFNLAQKVLNWRWHIDDTSDVEAYANAAELENFTKVALPQGLVSAGFFANALLISFDENLRRDIGNEISEGIYLEDACRYVDDLRIVVMATNSSTDEVQDIICKWLQKLLDDKVPGMCLSESKTKVVELGNSQRPFVQQSQRMNQIQSAVSGGFDAISGAEILDKVQKLTYSQENLGGDAVKNGWPFSPLSDVRDETVARFSASRFRSTYRSIRPLLEDSLAEEKVEGTEKKVADAIGIMLGARTKQDIDNDAYAFALNLVERWITDPSNVRLLRIGLDIWPDAEILKAVLTLLAPFTRSGVRRGPAKRVAWYCLGELLRAGTVETGFVDDDESLPKGTCLEKYRDVLRKEAVRLVGLPAAAIPWYLRQQALLFLAAFDPLSAPIVREGQREETVRYRKLILFLRGQKLRLTSAEFATLAILSRRAFPQAQISAGLEPSSLSMTQKRKIAIRDPSFVLELSADAPDFFNDLPAVIKADLCVDKIFKKNRENLIDIVQSNGSQHPIRNELSLLQFSTKLLDRLQEPGSETLERVVPGQIQLKLECKTGVGEVLELDVSPKRYAALDFLYDAPRWCERGDRWRFQLGFLLRFILSGQPDFTKATPPVHWKARSEAYQPTKSHWYLRRYGLFHAQEAFGDDWVPVTDWMEQFLLALMHWPGCHVPSSFDWVKNGIAEAQKKIKERIKFLENRRGAQTKTLMLPIVAGRPTSDPSIRPLRACVIQTVEPNTFDNSDITLSKPAARRRHRNHLSTALRAVRQMMSLRDTHEDRDGRLDWLILPELAVHPSDVQTHLVPFARAHKTLILTGLTYQEVFPQSSVINSALWIMPEWTENQGLRIRIRRQGKQHLAPDERKLNVQGFRPCQWLIGYPWCNDQQPLWLSAAICYDATDLALATDLRDKSDVFAIPALNRDIKTFDQMALALHYHMFQAVVLVNNGKYGGSNAYWPSDDPRKRQIFHLHGQPQASIAFLDIDALEIASFLNRRKSAPQRSVGSNLLGWKHPPAGLEDG